VLEYHGDHHRDRDRFRRDVTRAARLRAAGWIVVDITQADLDRPAELIGRIRSELARAARTGRALR